MIKIMSIFALGAAVLSIWSCSKSSSSSSATPYTMTATKGSSNVTFSGQSNVIAFAMGNMMEIEGVTTSGSDTTGFIFMINNYSGVGSYALNGTTNVGEYITKTASSASILLAAHGNITITSATAPNMKGTFYFTATDSTQISGGSFTAKM